MVMKVIIAGSRDIYANEFLDNVLEDYTTIIDEVVSGGARGIDTLAIMWAVKKHLPMKVFVADWNKYGKSAGAIRNKEMAEYADYLIAIWDGESKGTKNMIDVMTKLGKGVTVIHYGKERSETT